MDKVYILSYLSGIKADLDRIGIEKIGLFGSFTKGTADLYSDVGVVIETTSKICKKFSLVPFYY